MLVLFELMMLMIVLALVLLLMAMPLLGVAAIDTVPVVVLLVLCPCRPFRFAIVLEASLLGLLLCCPYSLVFW